MRCNLALVEFWLSADVRRQGNFARARQNSAERELHLFSVKVLVGQEIEAKLDAYQPVAKYPTDLAGWIAAGTDLDAWEIPHPGGHLRQLLAELKALREGKAIALPAEWER